MHFKCLRFFAAWFHESCYCRFAHWHTFIYLSFWYYTTMVNVASLQLSFWVVGGAQISMCAKSHPIWNSVSEICIEYPSAPHWKYHIVNNDEKLSHTGQASSYWNKIFQKIISKYISQRSQQVISRYHKLI